MKRNTEGVIFDLDGTLVDSKNFMILSFTTILSAHGFSFPLWEEFLAKCRGMNLETAYQILTGLPDVNFLCKEHRRWQATNAGMVSLFSGVRETLEKIRARGMLIALATNRGSSAEEELRRVGISKFFSAIRHLGNTPKEFQKPHPRMILDASEELDIDTKYITMVGDMDDDLNAGKAARVQKVIAASYGFIGPEIANHNPDHVIHDIRDLLKLIS